MRIAGATRRQASKASNTVAYSVLEEYTIITHICHIIIHAFQASKASNTVTYSVLEEYTMYSYVSIDRNIKGIDDSDDVTYVYDDVTYYVLIRAN